MKFMLRFIAGFLLCLAAPHLMALDNGVNPTNMGKGDWYFYLQDAETNLGYTNVQALFNYEASQGVQFVVVKAQDGTTTGDWGYSSSVVSAAHSAGMYIFAYGYLYGNYYGSGGEAAELSTTLSIISSTSPDGFIIDAEVQYTNQPTEASNYCAGFKASYPNLFLSYSPFVDISDWPSYPYIQFGQYCDAVMPQAYFELGYGYTPSQMVAYMDSQWSSWQNELVGTQYAGSIKPIVPICQAFNNQYFTDNGSDLIDFVEDLTSDTNPATAGGYHGVSFFCADDETSGMRTEIAEASIGTHTDNAAFVSQSLPNNSVVSPDQIFSCSWVMQNNGTTIWGNGGYTFNTNGGTPMGAPGLTFLSSCVFPGSNCAVPTINFTAPTATGTYTADFQMNNTAGVFFGTKVSLTVIVAVKPAITTQPANQTVIQGQNATFSVTATGTAPLAYQWSFNDVNISGATASSYTIDSAQTDNAGSYAVVVTNVAGTVTSSTATLTVNVPPSITTQPVSQIVDQGQNATFSVAAAGTAPLSYQWTFNGADIAGATATSYTVSSAQADNAGSYAVVVTNVAGTVTSSTATLTVILPPIISTQPASQLASVSNSVTFTVGLSQGTSPAYQWESNGIAISGATTSSLTLSSVSWGSAGTYKVIVTNSDGSVTSSNAILTVEQAAFSYTNGFEGYALGVLDKNYADQNTNASNPWWGPVPPNLYVFNATNGVTPYSGTNMVGGTPGVTICQDYINLPFRMNSGQIYYGNFMCDWWFYDPFGTNVGATNFQDYLAVVQYAPVSLTNDFVTTTFTTYNQRMSLGAYNATGYVKTNYQARLMGATGGFNTNGWFNTTALRSEGWHHGRFVLGIPVANSAPVSMFIDNMYTPVFTYTNSGGTNGFNLVELNANMGGPSYGGYYDNLIFRPADSPWIAQQPASLTNSVGTSATFTTVAVGTAYQWQFDSTNISGATSTTYTLTNVQTTNAGSYTCVITGTNGTVATTAATLTVP